MPHSARPRRGSNQLDHILRDLQAQYVRLVVALVVLAPRNFGELSYGEQTFHADFRRVARVPCRQVTGRYRALEHCAIRRIRLNLSYFV